MKRQQHIQRKTPLRPAKPERFFCPDCGAERPGSTCEVCGSSGLAQVLTAKPVVKPKQPKDPIPAHTRAALKERSGSVCERCSAARATEAHHVQARRGGDHSLANLKHLCSLCHLWVTTHPAEATAEGFMRSQWGEAS